MRKLVLLAAALYASPAAAFCGFFVAGSNAKLSNNASQVALLRQGNKTVMTMSNNYQGPPENFAMVVPVPVVLHKEDVKTLPADVFDHIDALSAPRLVEYWERDPCAPPIVMMPSAAGGAVPVEEKAMDGHGVKVEARFAVGEYEIVILSARDSGGLEKWLHEQKYHIPDGAAEALAPYVREQMKFFVAKVNIQKVHRDAQGVVVLSPLRTAFESNELRLPVRLGLLNASGKQDLIVYILHPTSRYEVANYPNVFIPTNIEVADEVRKAFPSFYAELFDQTLLRANNKAVVTEYSWQSNSCDPCPIPPLEPDDIATLGGDVAGAGKGGVSGDKMGGYYGVATGWVLTRLHTRYDKQTLSEDLIFKAAKPVMGGRSQWNGQSDDAGAKVTDSGENNFQGRYIIRHYWTGPVKCKNPVYNDWSGPPPNGENNQPTAAKGLANAPRGSVALKNVVESPVPSLGLAGKPPHRRK